MTETEIGRVAQLWRYPVKSMAGQRLGRVFVGHGGLYGDRLYALVQPGGRAAFPWVTAREHPAMLLHRPMFRHPERAVEPPNWEAFAANGTTPLYGTVPDLAVDVITPAGNRLDLEKKYAIERLRETLPGLPEVELRRSERALTDCGPVSMVDSNFVAEVSGRLGAAVDVRSFRANLLLELHPGVRLDELPGRQLRVGDRLTVLLTERQGRCVLLTLDADGGPAHPELLRDVAKQNEGTAGVLAVPVREGIAREGDPVFLL